MIIQSKLLNTEETIYYSNLFSFDITGKANFLNMISGRNLFYTSLAFFTTLLIYLFIVYLSSNLVDSIVLGVIRIFIWKNNKNKIKIQSNI